MREPKPKIHFMALLLVADGCEAVPLTADGFTTGPLAVLAPSCTATEAVDGPFCVAMLLLAEPVLVSSLKGMGDPSACTMGLRPQVCSLLGAQSAATSAGLPAPTRYPMEARRSCWEHASLYGIADPALVRSDANCSPSTTISARGLGAPGHHRKGSGRSHRQATNASMAPLLNGEEHEPPLVQGAASKRSDEWLLLRASGAVYREYTCAPIPPRHLHSRPPGRPRRRRCASKTGSRDLISAQVTYHHAADTMHECRPPFPGPARHPLRMAVLIASARCLRAGTTCGRSTSTDSVCGRAKRQARAASHMKKL